MMLNGTERAVRSGGCGMRKTPCVCLRDNLQLKFSALSGAVSGGDSHRCCDIQMFVSSLINKSKLISKSFFF